MDRVWDRFLTEQDHAYQRARPSFSTKRGIGIRPALLIIDVYRCVFGEEPAPLLEAIESDDMACGYTAWQALPHIQRLLGIARSVEIPVIHVTKLVDIPDWGGMSPGQVRNWDGPSPEQRRRFEFMDEVAPIAGEIVIRKASTSAFASTPLAAILNQLAVDTVVVAGESTSGCVRAAVVDARNLRLSVVIAEECVFDRTEASHAINLYDMHRKYAHVQSLELTQEYLSTCSRWRDRLG